MEWSHILEWEKNLLFVHKIVYSMEWSLGVGSGVEWSGVRIWRGKNRMECSCDVYVCVCVAKFSVIL